MGCYDIDIFNKCFSLQVKYYSSLKMLVIDFSYGQLPFWWKRKDNWIWRHNKLLTVFLVDWEGDEYGKIKSYRIPRLRWEVTRKDFR